MKEFKGQVVWITGASSGIGRALANQLSHLGALLILSSRREEELKKLKSALPLPDDARVLPMDVSKTEEAQSKAARALEYFGRIDILINNAGISQRSAVEDTSLEIDRYIFEVNFFGNIALTRAVLPHMLQRNKGRIIVISSVAGRLGPPFRSAYAGSKHALHGWYDALRAETGDRGIQVHLICPGYIKTHISFNALDHEGKKHGVMDPGQDAGMSAEKCAEKILEAVKKGKKEVIIGKEWIFVWIRKFFPGIYYRALQKRARQKAY